VWSAVDRPSRANNASLASSRNADRKAHPEAATVARRVRNIRVRHASSRVDQLARTNVAHKVDQINANANCRVARHNNAVASCLARAAHRKVAVAPVVALVNRVTGAAAHHKATPAPVKAHNRKSADHLSRWARRYRRPNRRSRRPCRS